MIQVKITYFQSDHKNQNNHSFNIENCCNLGACFVCQALKVHTSISNKSATS